MDNRAVDVTPDGGKPQRVNWSSVGALLTDEDRDRIEHGQAPALDLSSADHLASPPKAAKPPPAVGLLARFRQVAGNKMTASREDLLRAFSDVLQVPGLPPGQREVLSTTTYAVYRTVREARDREALRQLLPRIEQIIGAAIEESSRRAAEEPGDLRTPDEVGTLCSTTSKRTFAIMHTVHMAHLGYELGAAAVTGGGSILALPFTVTAHVFLVGTMATVTSGCAEIYGTTSFLTNVGHGSPVAQAIECVATTSGSIEDRAMLDVRASAWTRAPVAASQQIARRWLAKSPGTGVPVLGKRLHEERTDLLVAALRAIDVPGASWL